jgi:hypothetical protein
MTMMMHSPQHPYPHALVCIQRIHVALLTGDIAKARKKADALEELASRGHFGSGSLADELAFFSALVIVFVMVGAVDEAINECRNVTSFYDRVACVRGVMASRLESAGQMDCEQDQIDAIGRLHRLPANCAAIVAGYLNKA